MAVSEKSVDSKAETQTQKKAEDGRNNDECHRFNNPRHNKRFRTCFHEGRAYHPAYQGMRRTCGQAKIPGDQVPDAGTHQGSEDDRFIDNCDINDALSNRIGNMKSKKKEGNKIKECRPSHGNPRSEDA